MKGRGGIDDKAASQRGKERERIVHSSSSVNENQQRRGKIKNLIQVDKVKRILALQHSWLD